MKQVELLSIDINKYFAVNSIITGTVDLDIKDYKKIVFQLEPEMISIVW